MATTVLGPGGYPRGPYGNFALKRPPPSALPPSHDLTQLDRGLQFQSMLTYRGPSLGWVQTVIKPQRLITVGGTYFIQPGDGIILVNAMDFVTIILPFVADWVNESFYQPAESFDRSIWVKDIGGHAADFNINIYSQSFQFPFEWIDDQDHAVIVAKFGVAKIYPLTDLTGWFLDI
jgi:hypothetical protein